MLARSSVFESSVERAAAAPAVKISEMGNAAMMQSLLTLRGGGGGVGEAIDGARILMERIITVIQIAAIVYVIYKVMEMERMFKQKVEEAMAELRKEWKDGWERHEKAMEELKEQVHEHWEEGWERHHKAMEKLGELMPGKMTEFIEEGKERQDAAFRRLKDHFKLK